MPCLSNEVHAERLALVSITLIGQLNAHVLHALHMPDFRLPAVPRHGTSELLCPDLPPCRHILTVFWPQSCADVTLLPASTYSVLYVSE